MGFRRGCAALLMAGLITLTGAPARADSAPVMIGGYSVQPAVDLLTRYGVVTGDPSGNLRLGDTITRAELVKMIVVAAGQGEAAAKAQTEAVAFKDITGHWARGYIAVAKRMGFTSGYDDGTFRPNSPVSHAEAITMLLRASGLRPQGAWPGAYLDAARSAGVLTDALAEALPPQQQAVRAGVFLLAERAFTRLSDAKGMTLLEQGVGYSPMKISAAVAGAREGAISAPQAVVTGTAVGAVMVRVNGTPAQMTGQQFSATLALEPGRNEIIILAADDLGNTIHERLVIDRR